MTTVDITKDTYAFVCCNRREHGKSCGVHHGDSIYDYFRQLINLNRPKFKQGRIVKVNKSGCLSRCAKGPNIVIFPENIWYNYANEEDVKEIVEQHLVNGKIVERLLTAAEPLPVALEA